MKKSTLTFITTLSIIGTASMVALAATNIPYMLRKQICQMGDSCSSSSSPSTPGGGTTTPAQLSMTPTSATGMDVTGPATEGSYVTFTVRNIGDETTTAISTQLTNATNFEFGTDNCDTNTLAADATCTMTVRPLASTNGSLSGTLQATASTGGSVSASLSGTAMGLGPATLSANYTSISDMDVTGPATTGDSVTITITNIGGSDSTTLTTTLSNTTNFQLSNNTCAGQTLSSTESCTLDVTPTASSNLSYIGALTVSATTGGDTYVDLSGSATGFGTAQLSVIPDWIKGVDVVLPNTIGEWETFTVKNIGASGTTSAITISLSDTGRFELGEDNCTGQTLAPMATCTVKVRPTASTEQVLCGDLVATATTGGEDFGAMTGIAQASDGGLHLQYPIADTLGHRAYPTTNYGGSPAIYSMNWSSCNSWSAKIHFKFDLTGAPQNTDSALLHFFFHDQPTCWSGAAIFTHNIYMNDTAWGENTLTWNNQPADGDILSTFTATCSAPYGSQYFDIQTAYDAWMSGTSNNGVHVYSPTSYCNNNSRYVTVGSKENPQACYKPWLLLHEATP